MHQRQFSTIDQERHKGKMDGLDYYEDNYTYCWNYSDYVIQETRAVRIFGILSIPLLLVPTLILQLFFMYRYKSTFLHRQFLYATIVVTLISTVFVVFSNIVDAFCPLLNPLIIVTIFNRYMWYVELLLTTIFYLFAVYKLCKLKAPKTMQQIQTLRNDRLHLWEKVMIVCIHVGEISFEIGSHLLLYIWIGYMSIYSTKMKLNLMRPLLSQLAVNIPLGLICIVLLVIWFHILWDRKLLKNQVKFVWTQMGHTLFVIVVFLIWNISTLFSAFDFDTVVIIIISMIRITSHPFSGVHFLILLRNLQRKVTTQAQVIRHTNPPSTRVSLPTDTAEHALNFLSPRRTARTFISQDRRQAST